MPKEVLQYPSTEGISGTEMSLHWSKNNSLDSGEDGNVQLAITNHVWGRVPEPGPDVSAYTHPAHEHRGHHDCIPCAERAEALKTSGDLLTGKELSGMTEVCGGSVVGEYDRPATIVTMPLTRAEINRAIRVLRTARDQAFGADQ